MRPIRDAAHTVAKELLGPGMKEFFTRWGDNVYQEGTSLKTEAEARAYAAEKEHDIRLLQNQATGQHLYQVAEIPSE
jgi:hypothetical protein